MRSMGAMALSARRAASKGRAMDDWLHIVLALLVLVVPIAAGWLALTWSDRRARKPDRGFR